MPTLRPAHQSDLDRLVQLSRQLADHDIALGQRRPVRWSADPTDTIADALRNPSQHHITVAVDEHSDVIGACHTALMGDEHSCAAHIYELIIEEQYRSQGLGRALLDDAFEWCAEQAADEVSLGVAPLSTRSRHFYEQYGFDEVSILLVKTVPLEFGRSTPPLRT